MFQNNVVSVWQYNNDGEPVLLQELPHIGDVTDLTVSKSIIKRISIS